MDEYDERVPLHSMAADEPAKASVKLYRVVLCGLSGVGKTSIYRRIKDKKFTETTRQLNVPQTQECCITVHVNDNESVKINLVDTCGLERHNALTRSHFQGSNVVLVVYATNDKESFDRISDCVREARSYEPGAYFFLIRNKIDLEQLEEDVVSQQQEDDRYLHSTVFKSRNRVSAKSGEGIDELVKTLAAFLFKNVKRRSAKLSPRTCLLRQETRTRKSRCRCCSKLC